MTPLAEGALLRAAARAPVIGLDLLAPDGVLVLAPHPDDETLGCGAALAAAVAAGRDAHVAVLTDGGGSHPGSRRWPRERLAARRAEELAGALEELGEGRITHERLGYPDQGATTPDFPGVPETLERLARTMRARRLRTIWTTWEGDPHPDHVDGAALADALAEAFRTLVGEGPDVLRFPVWGRFVERVPDPDVDELLRFAPDVPSREAKARALARHATQMTPLIDDDPDGFVMPAPMQRHFVEHDELFVRRRATGGAAR